MHVNLVVIIIIIIINLCYGYDHYMQIYNFTRHRYHFQ